tara:strand:- start:868 stop:1425 length:558 start_codon:yes stop_codon:yes gene_type:complete
MKTFKEVLNESQKTYQFMIKIAGELPDGMNDKLETCLQKYQLVKLGPGKTTPITERPLDFPQLQNMEVTIYEAEVAYPVTPNVLATYIASSCDTDEKYVRVNAPGHDIDVLQEPASDEPYEAMLNTDYEAEDNQELAGGNRVMDLLKELEDSRKEREVDPTGGVKPGESQDIKDETQGAKSPIGS